MRINTVSFGNYNPNTIVNNPPYITNHPFYEYMRDNKLDFESTDLKNFNRLQLQEKDEDKFMSGLFWITAGGVGAAGYAGRYKIKQGWNKLFGKIKGVFHR